jgi:alginate O-acetyltransferase complex protein AlgI
MLFNSYSFIAVFLPLTLIAYYVAARWSTDAAKAVLAIASLVFYAIPDAGNLPLLLLSIGFNWTMSRLVVGTDRSPVWRNSFLAVGIVGDLGALVAFKYAAFISGLLSGDLSSHTAVSTIPLGISFFTFTQIAFLVDSRLTILEGHRFLDYLLFVTVFPHLIAGPIIHHREMIPQFRDPATYSGDPEKISRGICMFAAGLAKKVWLADGIAAYADQAFSLHAPTFLDAWCGATAYAFQIYFDFSGYSDMAIGLGLMFGLRLPVNFRSPYKADSIIEFWRRWHITLSRFLRDYLYIPLGGNRYGRVRRYVNLMITMLLGGLWHGANLTFLAWGAAHGAALAANHLWRGAGIRMPRTIAHILTLATIAITWVFFSALTDFLYQRHREIIASGLPDPAAVGLG